MKKILNRLSILLILSAAAFLCACSTDQAASITKPALVSKVCIDDQLLPS